jgi:hypothetical protein
MERTARGRAVSQPAVHSIERFDSIRLDSTRFNAVNAPNRGSIPPANEQGSAEDEPWDEMIRSRVFVGRKTDPR